MWPLTTARLAFAINVTVPHHLHAVTLQYWQTPSKLAQATYCTNLCGVCREPLLKALRHRLAFSHSKVTSICIRRLQRYWRLFIVQTCTAQCTPFVEGVTALANKSTLTQRKETSASVAFQSSGGCLLYQPVQHSVCLLLKALRHQSTLSKLLIYQLL